MQSMRMALDVRGGWWTYATTRQHGAGAVGIRPEWEPSELHTRTSGPGRSTGTQMGPSIHCPGAASDAVFCSSSPRKATAGDQYTPHLSMSPLKCIYLSTFIAALLVFYLFLLSRLNQSIMNNLD